MSKCSRGAEPGYFDLVVKAYPEQPAQPLVGAGSRAVASLSPGDKLLVKGPIAKFPWHDDRRRHVGMIAGGTGITPMYQIIQEAVMDPSDSSEIALLYASRREGDIILRRELDTLATVARENGKKFTVTYVLSEPGPSWQGLRGHVSPAAIKRHLPPPGDDTVVFVCGPPPMMESISGEKDFKNKENPQGRLRGALALLGFRPSQVFKF
jgi:cytochrome-b5 reductase